MPEPRSVAELSERLSERIQVAIEAVHAAARKHKDQGLFDTYHQLWLLLRELRGEINEDGEEPEEA